MTDVVASGINTGVSDGSGRIFVVTEPPLPATCVVCSRSANGAIKFIDFNCQLDYYGAVVFCEDCLKESLSLLEMVPTSKLEEVIRTLANAVEELEVATNERDKCKSIVSNLRDLGVVSLDDDNESEESAETTGEGEQADGTSVETESDSDGSDSVGGLEDIPFFKD